MKWLVMNSFTFSTGQVCHKHQFFVRNIFETDIIQCSWQAYCFTEIEHHGNGIFALVGQYMGLVIYALLLELMPQNDWQSAA